MIIVASVSCIYGLGSPESYSKLILHLHRGQSISREEILEKLVNIRYERNDLILERGKFRARGDIVEIFPAAFNGRALKVELFGDEVERITEFDVLSGKIFGERKEAIVFPASHYVTDEDDMLIAMETIRAELKDRIEYFRSRDKLLEAQRIEQRTNYDLEMISEMGYCSGIENYSRHLTQREPGQPPFTLIDYFPKDFLIVVDESHVTLPQLHAMYAGDRSRKTTLVENGFRLPSAFDNRPLTFEEFEARIDQMICVSATPAQYELERAQQIVEQIIRPTGLLDPLVEVRPLEGQIDDLISEIKIRVKRKERVLITTLTKKFAEHLTDFLKDAKIKVRYLHSDIATLERAELIRNFRAGKFDVLVGINLLREGLDLPEVSLIAILDADKEGFLRSDTALIQTIGRAARNANGFVILYADRMTDSMSRAIGETNRRRQIQSQYNQEHGIIPKTIEKPVTPLIEMPLIETPKKKPNPANAIKKLSKAERQKLIERLVAEMKEASRQLQFERAAEIRDLIIELEGHF